ncbi:MAG TPA: hypothetical protein VNL73_10140 [Verrucomicrobiae bacterium]|nr:hypothetical protein [Verrucomicrobiae bacterium]
MLKTTIKAQQLLLFLSAVVLVNLGMQLSASAKEPPITSHGLGKPLAQPDNDPDYEKQAVGESYETFVQKTKPRLLQALKHQTKTTPKNPSVTLVCPPSAILETEPCGMDSASLGAMELCGDTICGTAWAEAGLRDEDGYRMTFSYPTPLFPITWAGVAEFPILLIILQSSTVVAFTFAGAFDTAAINTLLEPGTYDFIVEPLDTASYSCASGLNDYVVWLKCPPPPANDSCQNATPIGEVADYLFRTSFAAMDGPPDCLEGINPDVWFCYTPTCSGFATVSLCAYSTFDTKITVYEGCVCPPSAPLVCNDDFCGNRSQVTFPVAAGNEYLIRAGGGWGSTRMSIQCCPCAKGDLNCDSIWSGADVVLMLNCVFMETDDCNLCFADVNCDGSLTPSDVVLELNRVFLAAPFPC